MSQRVEVVSNLRVRKNLPEGSTHGLPTLTFVRTFRSFTTSCLKRSGSREERVLSKSDEGTKGNATNQEGNGCEKHRAQQYSAGGVL